MTSVGTSVPSTVIVPGMRVVPRASRASGSTLLLTVNCSATCLPRVPFLILWPIPTDDTFGSSSRSGPRVRMYCFKDSMSLSCDDADFLGVVAAFFLLLVGMEGRRPFADGRGTARTCTADQSERGMCYCERQLVAITNRNRDVWHMPRDGDPRVAILLGGRRTTLSPPRGCVAIPRTQERP